MTKASNAGKNTAPSAEEATAKLQLQKGEGVWFLNKSSKFQMGGEASIGWGWKNSCFLFF